MTDQKSVIFESLFMGYFYTTLIKKSFLENVITLKLASKVTKNENTPYLGLKLHLLVLQRLLKFNFLIIINRLSFVIVILQKNLKSINYAL